MPSKMRKQHAWSNTLICRIDVTGFISVVAVLAFALWMRAATYTDLPTDFATLPVATHSSALYGADREDAMIVGINRDGRIFFDRKQVSPDELSLGIRKSLKQKPERKVYIRADSKARYRTVTLALEAIRAAGIEDIAFVTFSPPNPH